MSTTANEDVNTAWKDVLLGKVEYISTKIYPCIDCIHMPYGINQECKLTLPEVLYCKTNNHCFKKKNPDCAIYVSNKKKFIEEKDFEV